MEERSKITIYQFIFIWFMQLEVQEEWTLKDYRDLAMQLYLCLCFSLFLCPLASPLCSVYIISYYRWACPTLLWGRRVWFRPLLVVSSHLVITTSFPQAWYKVPGKDPNWLSLMHKHISSQSLWPSRWNYVGQVWISGSTGWRLVWQPIKATRRGGSFLPNEIIYSTGRR